MSWTHQPRTARPSMASFGGRLALTRLKTAGRVNSRQRSVTCSHLPSWPSRRCRSTQRFSAAMARWHAASVDQNFWPHRPLMRKWRPSSLIRFSMSARPWSRRHTASASNSLNVAGRKPPKMGGLNRVVSAGMNLLGTSKKIFFWFFLRTRRLQWSFTGDFPTAGFGGAATATLTPRATRLGKWPRNADARPRASPRADKDVRRSTRHNRADSAGSLSSRNCRCSHPSCSLARGRDTALPVPTLAAGARTRVVRSHGDVAIVLSPWPYTPRQLLRQKIFP